MKKKNYIKPTMINHSDEDAVFNTFPLCILAGLELFLLAILRGEINWLSITLLIGAGIVLAVLSFRIGEQEGAKNHGKK